MDYSSVGGNDKFVCGIVLSVNEHDYFAPITSFKKSQQTNIIIKDSKGKDISSIRFSFMIPIPPEVATVKKISEEPSLKHRRFLNAELAFCQREENTKEIKRVANMVYYNVVKGKDHLMVRNSCNFKLLEEKCVEYAKEHGLELRPPESKLAPAT